MDANQLIMRAVKKALAASKTYTNEVVVGGGAIKGKNCVVTSIDDIVVDSKVVGHKVNFQWTLDNGTIKSDSMDVMNGEIDDTPIESLSDIEVNNLQNGQILKYNATTQKWENKFGEGTGGHTVVDEEGNAFPQRSSFEFRGMKVTDNEENDKTIIENEELSTEQVTNLISIL